MSQPPLIWVRIDSSSALRAEKLRLEEPCYKKATTFELYNGRRQFIAGRIAPRT